jgi:uncharacterized protein (DUF1778 family)
MTTKQITTRLDKPIADALKAYCESQGLIINRFIQDCIIDKLEEVVDIADIPKLRKDKTRPFADVLAELKLNG